MHIQDHQLGTLRIDLADDNTMRNNQGIGDKTLIDTYSLAFSKITGAILKDYRKRFGGAIGIIIKHRIIIIMRNGKHFETISTDNIDGIFNKIGIQQLRKNLKKL